MSSAPPSKPLVLVVDDDEVNQMLLTDVCNAEGYEVLTAGDGEAAIEAFKRQDVDLVLLDVAMPKIDGFTACRMMRDLRPVPVIIVTATNEQQAEAQARACGAAAFMTKPFRVFELSRKMRAAMRPSLSPSEPPGRDELARRREAVRVLGSAGGPLELRRSLRKVQAGGGMAAVFARLDNEREILEGSGRTARDAIVGALCAAIQQRVPLADVYCAESNEVVALLPEASLDEALQALAEASNADDLGVGPVVVRWTGTKLASGGSDVDGVMRSLRELARGEGGSGSTGPGTGQGSPP